MVTVWKKLLWILIPAAVLIVVLFVVFRGKPMIAMEENPYIASISMTVGQDGETREYRLSQSETTVDGSQGEISEELNDGLIALFSNAKMRNTLLGPPEIYTITDDSVSISIQILLDTYSVRVNLSTKPDYNYVQCGETHYRIIAYEQLYQKVYDVVSDAMQDK